MADATCSQRVPCARCPWRKDADPSYWHIGEFERTAKGVTGQDGVPVLTADGIRGISVMLCHKSPGTLEPYVRETPPDAERSPLSGTLAEPALCAGYVAVTGYDYVGLRMYASRNKIDPTKLISDGGLALYGSMDEMLEAVRKADALLKRLNQGVEVEADNA